MGEPLLHAAVTTSFFFNVGHVTCQTLTADGTISGWCSDAVGSGVTNTGHRFSFVVLGRVAVVSGEVTGTGYLSDFASPGCASGLADQFFGYWALVLAHI